MSIAVSHLRGRRFDCEAECIAHELLDRRRCVGIGPNGTADLSNGDRPAGIDEPRVVSGELEGPIGQFQTEAGRFCPDAVGPAEHECLAVFESTTPGDLEEERTLVDQEVGGIPHQDGVGGVEHIGRCQAVVDPLAPFPGIGSEKVDKGSHVVVRHFLSPGDLVGSRHPGGVGCLGSRFRRSSFRHPGIYDCGFDSLPCVESVLVRPDGGHLGQRVARDHGAPILPAGGHPSIDRSVLAVCSCRRPRETSAESDHT